jgi:hypothetical protein
MNAPAVSFSTALGATGLLVSLFLSCRNSVRTTETPGAVPTSRTTSMASVATPALKDAGRAPLALALYDGEADVRAAFWTADEKLAVQLKSGIVLLDPKKREAPVAVEGTANAKGVFARKGASKFLIHDAKGAVELWDALSMKRIMPIAHTIEDSSLLGGMAPDGSAFALPGCVGFIQSAAKMYPECGVLFDTDGRPRAQLKTRHAIRRFTFSNDGKYLVAASYVGLTVFEVASGKAVLSRPQWAEQPNMHSAIPSDLAHFVDSSFIISHGSRIEVFDLESQKTVAMASFPNMTETALAQKSKRVAVLIGVRNLVQVWDIASNKTIRSIPLGSYQHGTCQNCVLEVDDADEDRLWVTPLYSNERYEIRIASQKVTVVSHTPRDVDAMRTPSTERPQLARIEKTSCELLTENQSPRALPSEVCSPYGVTDRPWPFPGLSPSKASFAAMGSESQLLIVDVATGTTTHSLRKKPD